ncbi:hypothetical protein [Flavobacterium frigidarium]
MKKNILSFILILLCNSMVLSQNTEIVKAIDENVFEIKDVDPSIE